MGTKVVVKDGKYLSVGGKIVLVDVPGGSSECGTDIIITTAITNAYDFLQILQSMANLDAYTFSIKQYNGGAPLDNQIISGAVHGKIGCGLKYRNGAYQILGRYSTEYDAATAVGDVYTIWEAVY